MAEINASQEMMRLFETLIAVVEEHNKKINKDNASSRLIFEIYKMWASTQSKIFNESALWLSSETASLLLEQGLIQKIPSEQAEKYALTFTGIAQCIKKQFDRRLDEQFLDFLALVDEKFNAVEQDSLTWDEKLATLSLVLLASYSPSSAIRLNNETNRKTFTEVFQRTLTCLKTHGLISKKEELRKVNRGESLASALMSRLFKLARKTNHYYRFVGKGSQYYLDIENNGAIDEKRLHFLLGKVFGQYNPECDYEQMFKELEDISQLYYPRFTARALDPNLVLSISKMLMDFMQTEILHLPMQKPEP
jgi:hypothetical protein